MSAVLCACARACVRFVLKLITRPSPISSFPLRSDAVVLSTVCKPLHAAVAASKWPPYSTLPHVAPDGTVSEPLSGRFSITCRPEEGEEGIQRAIDGCEEGGSILLQEGVYPARQTLRIARSVHLFGRGRTELRGTVPQQVHLIRSTAPSATLDRIRVDNQTRGYSGTLLVSTGALRLQGCGVASRVENGCPSLRASGPSAIADVLGCSFQGGGGDGIMFRDSAAGRVERCDIRDFGLGSGICLWGTGAGASPLVARNEVRDCKKGVRVMPDVGASWSLGEGNVFVNCARGEVVDKRAHAPLPPPPA